MSHNIYTSTEATTSAHPTTAATVAAAPPPPPAAAPAAGPGQGGTNCPQGRGPLGPCSGPPYQVSATVNQVCDCRETIYPGHRSSAICAPTRSKPAQNSRSIPRLGHRSVLCNVKCDKPPFITYNNTWSLCIMSVRVRRMNMMRKLTANLASGARQGRREAEH